MEGALADVLDQVASTESVRGVLLADERGLCLGARGTANPSSAGFVASVAIHARDLYESDFAASGEPENRKQFPTVTVEMDDGATVIIRNEGSYTLAIFK